MVFSQSWKKPVTALKGSGLSLSRKNSTCDLSYIMIHSPNMLKTKEQNEAGTWVEKEARGAEEPEIGI